MDDEELWQAYAWPSLCLRVNFVISLDGHIQGPDGLSGTLSGPHDRRLFHMLRAGCDAIMVGAGTARTETYKSVAIRSPWEQFREQSGPPTLILVSASGNVPEIEGAIVSDGSDLTDLRERYPKILCEGGPRLFSTLLEEGLVDELALSISAGIGGFGSLVLDGVSAQTRPKHTHVNDEGLFTLWDVT